MPHTLETAADAHQTLREVERVLRPEGRLLITGFNPASLWGLARRRAAWSPDDWIGYWRLRDWLRLLSFEVEGGRFGCYAPPVSRAAWLERLRWMESVGDRWWPVLGGVYAVMAVKRVRGMRVVGLARNAKARKAAAPAVAAHGRHRVMPMSGAPVLPPKREEGGA
jgi:SAM-dependent methyltransferase